MTQVPHVPWLWAPKAQGVELVVGGKRTPMAPSPDHPGHFVGPSPLAAGTRYAFHVDGVTFPDPRGRSLPEGVHGPTEVVALDDFSWSDASFVPTPLADGIIYELHLGTFTPRGTLDSAIERLPELVDLGITHVELMPVNAFPGRRGWGYDGVGLFAVHRAYGGPRALMRFVDRAHALGLSVLLDVVYNHLGPDGNYLGLCGPYFTDRYHTPWGEAVNLDDRGSDQVRGFFLDNAEMWLSEFHLDGLRLDAVHALIDDSATHLLEALSQRAEQVSQRVGRRKVLIAESDLNDPRIIRPRERHGLGMDAQWSDDLHHAVHALLTGEHDGYYVDFGSTAAVAKALENGFVFDGVYNQHRGRVHGRPLDDVAPQRLLAYVQTHDQVGNRAQGERLAHLVPPAAARAGAAVALLSPHIPMLFQGEEWACTAPFQYFTDHVDAGLAEAVRKGRAREFSAFGWDPDTLPDPQAPETRDRSQLDWSERQEGEHAETLRVYRELIALRHRQLSTLHQVPSVTFDEAARVVVMERPGLTVAINLSDAPQTAPVHQRTVLWSSHAGITPSDNAVQLPAWGIWIAGDPASAAD